ncbi:MAG: 3',5'-cyclic-nucleotide phosphodiesterase [Cyanobacteria bacterium M_surface_10_m1_298]|nr:3',5'-cyclic-nucleotide phosphodiesterase [Cyanobacteria bacterium M_surface_10_m1_298]
MPRILQFSDPHLLADPQGLCRGLPPREALLHGLRQALKQLEAPVDLLLISGDLCQDESWGGYVRLREVLEGLDLLDQLPVALIPGNHDHPQLLRAALGRHCALAPEVLRLGSWRLLLLSSHRTGAVAGWISEPQRRWILQQLNQLSAPTLVALHHPPLPIGSAALDPIALEQADQLLEPLLRCAHVKGLVFGHVHQHWFGALPRPQGGEPLPLWGCPSSLVAFEAVQPCPLGQPDWPGARVLELSDAGAISTTLLRWSPLASA